MLCPIGDLLWCNVPRGTGPVLKFEHFLGLFCRIRVLEKLVGKAMAIEIGIFYAVQLSTQCLALLLASYEFRSDAASV